MTRSVYSVVHSRSGEGTSWASVAKEMQGSFNENNAQDFDLKLMPWKQANEMLFPCSSIVPPSTVPDMGSGKQSVARWRPPTWAKTRCQWRWCLASCRLEVAQVWELAATNMRRRGWRFMFSGMWHCIVLHILPDVSQDCVAFIFKGQALFWTAWPLKIKVTRYLNTQKQLPQQYIVK